MKTRTLITLSLAASLSACCCSGQPEQQVMQRVVVVPEAKLHGTVTETWAEPMYDTVKMEGQIDPTNTYYRAPHQTVVEIRPGKYRNVSFSGDPR